MLLPRNESIVWNETSLAVALSRNTRDWTMLTNEDIDLNLKIQHGQELPGIVVLNQLCWAHTYSTSE